MYDGEIRIVDWYLEALYAGVSKAAIDLGTNTLIPRVDLSASPRVDQAWTALFGRWDEHRTHLSNTLWDVESSLRIIRDSFRECDGKLSATLKAPQ